MPETKLRKKWVNKVSQASGIHIRSFPASVRQVAGIPDTHVSVPGSRFWLELKGPRTVVKNPQLLFLGQEWRNNPGSAWILRFMNSDLTEYQLTTGDGRKFDVTGSHYAPLKFITELKHMWWRP